mmetsp:Transcript_53285/g.139787  ORF Transcript_53285/g.139787 Transcript_53285/m.139787 type:complete len:348 (+) Transcript_53285:118-1161(+)
MQRATIKELVHLRRSGQDLVDGGCCPPDPCRCHAKESQPPARAAVPPSSGLLARRGHSPLRVQSFMEAHLASCSGTAPTTQTQTPQAPRRIHIPWGAAVLPSPMQASSGTCHCILFRRGLQRLWVQTSLSTEIDACSLSAGEVPEPPAPKRLSKPWAAPVPYCEVSHERACMARSRSKPSCSASGSAASLWCGSRRRSHSSSCTPGVTASHANKRAVRLAPLPVSVLGVKPRADALSSRCLSTPSLPRSRVSRTKCDSDLDLLNSSKTASRSPCSSQSVAASALAFSLELTGLLGPVVPLDLTASHLRKASLNPKRADMGRRLTDSLNHNGCDRQLPSLMSFARMRQ